MHRIGRTGRVGRSGRAITFYEPRQARDIQAIERHAGVKLSPWVKDAHVAPTPVKTAAAPPLQAAGVRHANGDGADRRKVIVSGGRAAGLEPSDIIHAITSATELDGEAVRNVRVLERFAFVEVPQSEAERVVEQTGGTEVRGHVLRLELARDLRPAPPGRPARRRTPDPDAGARTPPARSRPGAAETGRWRKTRVSGRTAPRDFGAPGVLWMRRSLTRSTHPRRYSLRLHSLVRRRPSPAIVISSVALFMSLGGVGYAAISIPNNSVGTNQLKNNAVSYKKIQAGAVGIVRANTGQLQVRVSGTCATGQAIGTINQVGKVTCNNALPSEFGTTNNTAAVTATPATVTTVALPNGASYFAFGNPTATVTSGAAAQRVTVTCTLTVGSNTETRSVIIPTDGTAGDTSTQSIPLQGTGGSGTGSVSCTSAVPTGTAPTVSVTSAINAIQTASNS